MNFTSKKKSTERVKGFQKLSQLWIARWLDWLERTCRCPQWHVGLSEKGLDSSKNVTYLNAAGELESGQRRATDPIWSLKVYNVSRSIMNGGESVHYYRKDGPKRGFVTQQLQIVPPRTKLPLEGIRWVILIFHHSTSGNRRSKITNCPRKPIL